MFDEFLQPVIAEDLARRAQQIEGKVRVTIGEAAVAKLGQPPVLSRPPASFALILALYQPSGFELEEMLPRAGRGHGET